MVMQQALPATQWTIHPMAGDMLPSGSAVATTVWMLPLVELLYETEQRTRNRKQTVSLIVFKGTA